MVINDGDLFKIIRIMIISLKYTNKNSSKNKGKNFTINYLKNK